MTASQTVDRYFELATQADSEPYFSQFTHDAVVEDEGREYHGIDEIRRWRIEVPQVKYDVFRGRRIPRRQHHHRTDFG